MMAESLAESVPVVSSSLSELIVGHVYFITNILYRFWNSSMRGQYYLKIGDRFFRANAVMGRFFRRFMTQTPYDGLSVDLSSLEMRIMSKAEWGGKTVVRAKLLPNADDTKLLKKVIGVLLPNAGKKFAEMICVKNKLVFLYFFSFILKKMLPKLFRKNP